MSRTHACALAALGQNRVEADIWSISIRESRFLQRTGVQDERDGKQAINHGRRAGDERRGGDGHERAGQQALERPVQAAVRLVWRRVGLQALSGCARSRS